MEQEEKREPRNLPFGLTPASLVSGNEVARFSAVARSHYRGPRATAVALAALAFCSCDSTPISITGLKYTIGGTLSGLSASNSLVLQNNGGDNTKISANGVFAFATSLTNGASYSATILTQPTNEKCVVANGSGTVGVSNVNTIAVTCVVTVSGPPLNNETASLVGDFTWVHEGVADEADGLSLGTLDGTGGFTSTSTNNVAGTIFTGSDSGVYGVSTAAVMTFADNSGNTFNGGTELATFNSFVLMDIAPGEQPSLVVAVKPNPSGATNASVQGTYSGADLEIDANGLGSTQSVTTLTLDGAGNITGTQTTNRNGTISAPEPVVETYSVAANGAVTVGSGSHTGAFTADGTLFVAADQKSGDAADVEVFVKVGTAESLATLSGTYSVAVLQSNNPGADAFLSRITFDGNGNFSGTQTENNAGTITAGTMISGTYTVAPNGALTIELIAINGDTNSWVGALSFDGSALVFGHLTTGAVPILGVGLKQY
jgi:hypothetical protein